MRPLCGIQFLTWFAWFCFIVYGTDWIATDIYGGDAHAAKHSKLYKQYSEGKRHKFVIDGSLGSEISF